jgi:penicillin-binding protein 1C
MERPRLFAAATALTLVGALAFGMVMAWRAEPMPDLARLDAYAVTVSDRHGRLLSAFTTPEGRWRLPLGVGDVDARYLALLKSYEDKRFDHHRGVDPLALLRALWQVSRHGGIVSGGSTLSMQVARLIEPRRKRSLPAKLRQMALALKLEQHLDKRGILDLYLTLAPYGGNLEGLRAASWSYFGKEPKRLSLAEAALLVALPQSPETRRPDRFAPTLQRMRDRVIDRAVSSRLATVEEARLAKAEPVPNARRPFPTLAIHAAETAMAERPRENRHRLSIDARWQASLEALLRERVEALGPKLAGAILVIEHETGKVRAHIGGVGHLDKERAGALDLARAVRSPGSALKPFIYALAFENGIAHPETWLEDRPGRYGAYAPENFDLTFQGTVSARQALQQSLNLPAIALLAEVGPQRLTTRLLAAGAAIQMPKDSTPGLAVGLGGIGLRLTDLAKLYAGLARGGETVALTWREAAMPDKDERRLTEPLAAWYVGDILKGAPPPANAPGGRIAYKTGTSYGYRDAWAIGFDRRHTVAVWVGRPDASAVPGLVARQVAAPILFDAFARIGTEPDQTSPPAGALQARNASLPMALRHLRRDIPKTVSAAFKQPLRIAFPPDGARLDIGQVEASEPATGIALKALGGVTPLTWMVDGVPVTQAELRRESQWRPSGIGFVRLSVIDATGATDSVRIRLEE